MFTGVNKNVLALTTILLSAAACALTYCIGRDLHNKQLGLTAALLLWIWPAPFVWWSVKIGGNYWLALDAALMCAWLVVRRRDTPYTVNQAALIGLSAGIAWWSNPQVIYVLVPVALTFPRAVVGLRSRVLPALGGFVVGAAPWLYINVLFPLVSLKGNSTVSWSQAVDNFGNVFANYLPALVGFRNPFSQQNIGGGFGLLATYAFLVLVVIGLVKSRERPRVALVGVSLFVLMFSASLLGASTDRTRYWVWIGPWIALAVAAAVRAPRPSLRKWTVGATIATALAVSLTQIGVSNKGNVASPLAPDVPAPLSISPLIDLLDADKVTLAHGDYWLSYRVIFETHERITLAPTYTDRNLHYSAAVKRSPTPPPFAFVRSSPTYVDFQKHLNANGIGFRTTENADYALVFPDRLVDPKPLAELLKSNEERAQGQ